MSESTTPAVAVPVDNYYTIERTFKFKGTKDADGKPVKARAPVTLEIPAIGYEYLVALMAENKTLQNMMVDLANESITDAVRFQLSEDNPTGPVTSQADLNLEKLDLVYLSSIPKIDRRGGGIAKEVWDAFAADYIEVMVTKGSKSKEKSTGAAMLLSRKFAPVRTRKDIVETLQGLLNTWFTLTDNTDQFAEVFEFLTLKANSLLEAREIDYSDLIG